MRKLASLKIKLEDDMKYHSRRQMNAKFNDLKYINFVNTFQKGRNVHIKISKTYDC